MLKIWCLLQNVYINKQSNPLCMGDILLWICSFFAKSRDIWWFGCHGNLYLNNIVIFIFWILLIRCGLARMCINYPYFCLHKQENLLWNWSKNFWRSFSSVAMETKIIIILSFYLFMAFVNQTWVILTLYMSFIYSFAVKDNQIWKWSIFSVLKIGFHGVTFVARQHKTNDIFHFSLNFCAQLMWSSKGI